MKKIILLFCILLSFVSLTSPVRGQEERYYFSTDNFVINYQAQHEEIAFEVADIAEEIHSELVNFFDYSPAGRTHIIISDDQDIANSSAGPNYFNRIYLNLRQPDIYSGMVGYYQNWLETVLIHEYTHIVHLDMNRGRTSSIRGILGKIPLVSTPNIWQPYWLIEGYPMFTETKFSAGGRGNNDLNDMYFRAAVADNELYEIDQVHGPYDLGDWPSGGRGIYYYGLSLSEFIVKKYGEEKFVELSKEFSQSMGQSINRIFREVLGADINQVYSEWRQEKETASGEIARQTSDFSASEKRLTDHGWITMNPEISPVNDDIAYIHNGKKFPALRILNEQGNEQLTGTLNNSGEGIAWSPDGKKIAFPDLNYYQKNKIYNDIFIYDLDTEQKERITYGRRAYSPVWKDEKTLIYLTQSGGVTSLEKQNLTTGRTTTLLPGKDDYSYSQLDISPGREQILMSVWHQGKRDIYLYDLEENQLSPLIVDPYINIHPAWSEDGKRVFFSSDRTGNFNIFAYDIEQKQLFQVTDVYTGAFEPQSKSGNEIIYIGYSARGYDLYALEYESDQWQKVESVKPGTENKISDNNLKEIYTDNTKDNNKVISENLNDKKEDDYNISKYWALKTMKPRYLIPTLQFSYYNGNTRGVLGLATGGIDALQNHQYQFNIRFNTQAPRPHFNLDYIYQMDSFPHLETKLSLSNKNHFQEGEYITSFGDYSFQVNYPLTRNYFYSQDLSTQFRYIQNLDQDSVNFEDLFLINHSWQGNLTMGQDDYTNNLAGRLNFGWLPEDKNQRQSLELTLKNRLYQGQKNEFAVQIFAGIDEITGYNVGRLNRIRSLMFEQNTEQLGTINLEYRRVLRRINQGMGHMPLFFKKLNGYLFYDYAYLQDRELEATMSTFGLELGLEMSELYGRSNTELIFGFNSEKRWYFRIGKYF
ncbi:MAG: hypothetical protein ACOC2O_01070 [Bacillota bacterium]